MHPACVALEIARVPTGKYLTLPLRRNCSLGIDRVIDHGFVDKVHDHGQLFQPDTYPGPPNPSMPPCITLPETIDIQSLITILASIKRANEAKQYYRPLCDSAEAPNAWSVFNSCICLPIHVDMHRADVEHMLKTAAYEVNSIHTV